MISPYVFGDHVRIMLSHARATGQTPITGGFDLMWTPLLKTGLAVIEGDMLVLTEDGQACANQLRE